MQKQGDNHDRDMIEKLPKSHGNIIGYSAGGQISEEDLERVDTELESLTKHYDKIRLLINYEDLSGIDLDALDEDLRMARFMDRIERLAVVSDQRIYDWVSSAYDKVTTDMDIRQFNSDELPRAWDWLE